MTQTTHDPLERELSALFATPVSYDVGEVTESVHAGVRQVRKTRRRRRVLAGTSALALAGIVTTAALAGGFGGTNNLNLPGSLATPAATTPDPTEPFVPAVGEKFAIPEDQGSGGYGPEDTGPLPAGPLTAEQLRAMIQPERAVRWGNPPITDAPRLSFGLVQRQDFPNNVWVINLGSAYTTPEGALWWLQACSDFSHRPSTPREFRLWQINSNDRTAGGASSLQRRATVAISRYLHPADAAAAYHRLVTNTGVCRLANLDRSEEHLRPHWLPATTNHGEPINAPGTALRLAGDTIVTVQDLSNRELFGRFDPAKVADNVVERIKLTNEGAPWSSSTNG